jgi:hypothetical protein
MWLKNFHQFVNHSLQRIADWACGIEFLPAWLVRRSAVPQEDSPLGLHGFGGGEAETAVELSYRYRSLHCHIRVGVPEPAPGMKFIYRVLQGSDKA